MAVTFDTLLEASLRADMRKMALRTDLEKTEAKMMGEMSRIAHRLTVRLGGAIGAGVGILVAVDKLFKTPIRRVRHNTRYRRYREVGS